MTVENSAYIQAQDLTLKTPMGPVYEHVSFTCGKGQVISIFGSEGCGKTSLLLTLAGRMKANSGTAKVAGFDLKKEYKKIRKISNITIVERVNDVPTNSRIDDIIAAELQVVGKSGRKAGVKAFLEEWDLTKLSGTRFRDLEAFEKKLFDVALACAGDPEILMVDDIQDGLTQHQGIRLMKAFKNLAQNRGMTIFVGIGEYDIARYADAVVVVSASAERQRRAVIKERGEGAQCLVAGCGNGVELDLNIVPVAQEGGR